MSDPATVAAQVNTIRTRFGIDRIALVGDRGMLTTARIRGHLEPVGLDWISALTTRDIRRLVRASDPPLVPADLADDAVADVTSPDFPGERLMVGRNPRLREERARKRAALLQATEEILEQIAGAVQSGRLQGKEQIGRRIGREVDRKKVGKHFDLVIGDASLSWQSATDRISAEAALDGVYVIRTNLDATAIAASDAVRAYKRLARVERAFRTVKQTRRRIRPVPVYSANHVRAHVFLCMLACHLEHHLRQHLAPLLFEDDDKDRAEERRSSPVTPAQVSESAAEKARTQHTPDGLPVHSMTTLLADLAALTLNTVIIAECPETPFQLCAKPTPLQKRASELLNIDPTKTVPSAKIR